MSTKSSTSSSSCHSLSESLSERPQTLSDWIRHKKCDLRPESRINAFKLQAEQSIDNKNFEDAINFYAKAIDLNGNDFSLYLNRSFCYEMIQKYELCLSDVQNAIQLSHQCFHKSKDKESTRYRNKLVFYRKGRALKALKRYQEAIDAFVEANNLVISCPFIDQEIKEIKTNFVIPLGYDRNDFDLICDQFDCIEDIIKQLNKNKESLISEDSDVMPTNPFRYKGLYVNGLKSDCNETQFEELLSKCGPILRCKLYSNDIQSRAIITFSDEQSVREAVKTIRANKHLIRDENELVIRYRHTCIEKGSDPQINFKGQEIAGECYRWRTNGCDDKDCKLLHIPICHHLDQQNFETESVKRKRTPIKFDIDLKQKKSKSNSIVKNRSLTSYDDLFDLSIN